MPADYQSTAQGLSVSPDRAASTSPATRPPWASHHRRISSSARLQRPSLRSASFRSVRENPRAYARQVLELSRQFGEQTLETFQRMPLLYRLLAILAVILGWVVLILAIIYSGSVFTWLAEKAKSWRDVTGGWVIMMFVVAATAFPPLMGYSTACTIAGFVYGFPLGWPIAAAGAILGSLGAFMASRTVLSGVVDRLVGHDKRFIALGQVLRRDGIWYLTGIRFCPLPFSLSNGFLATIPTITPLAFLISTAISMPKLLIHIFIGSRLAAIADDEDMSFGDKLVNWLGMAVGGIIGFGIGYIIYRRTMARAAELAREAETENAEEGQGRGFHDSDATMMDPEDAAELLGDDDISLWDTQLDDSYRDSEDGKTAGQNGR